MRPAEVDRPLATLSRRAIVAGVIGGLTLSALRPDQAQRSVAVGEVALPAPASGAAEGGGSFGELLGLVPDILAGPSLFAEFADVAAQLAALGVPHPVPRIDAGIDAWTRAVRPLALPAPASRHAYNPLWRETFGFDALQLDRSLVAGQPPGRIYVLQGHFVADELRTAWTRSGYRPVDVPGAEAYSFAADAEIAFDSDVGVLALNAMNNAALLPDGTVIFTSTLDRLRAAVATATGMAPSLRDRPDVQAGLAALPQPLATGYLVSGEALRTIEVAEEVDQGRPDEQAADEVMPRSAEGTERLPPMPPVRLAALGITAGGPLRPEIGEPSPTPASGEPVARFLIALLLDDRAAAETAVPIVERRLVEGQSHSTDLAFREFFADWTIAVAPTDPVLVVDLTFAPGRPLETWITLFHRRDLGFVGW